MDNKRFREIAGEMVINGVEPAADAVASVLSDIEFREEAKRRGYALSVGEVATSSSVRSQIERMLPAAYNAYKSNVNIINKERSKNGRIQVVAEGAFKNGAMDALNAPTLEYMESVVDESKGTTLWVPKSAPNVELTQGEIVNIAEFNAKLLHKPLYGWSNRLKFLNLFSRQELSGNNPNSNAKVLHQFAPTTFTSRLFGTVDHQKNELKTMRAENPNVNIHAPALAHSVGGWAIHADSGLSIPTNWESTYDRSVEVQPQRFDGRPCVPYSVVYGNVSDAGFSWTGTGSRGRAWVGSNLNLAA